MGTYAQPSDQWVRIVKSGVELWLHVGLVSAQPGKGKGNLSVLPMR